MEILKQLGDLFLAAVPTVIIVFLFYLFLRWAFFGPIEGIVHERSRRIQGARHETEQLRKNAQERMRAYQESLRRARGEIFRHQETLRRTALDERSAALRQARVSANEAIQEAKGRIRSEIEAARTELDSSTVQLAEQIARTILQPDVQMHPRQAGEV